MEGGYHLPLGWQVRHFEDATIELDPIACAPSWVQYAHNVPPIQLWSTIYLCFSYLA